MTHRIDPTQPHSAPRIDSARPDSTPRRTTTVARRRTALTAVVLAGAGLGLAACGAEDSASAEGGDTQVLKVAATPTPHSDILRFIDEEDLDADAGFELEVVEFTDYLQPNIALDEGSVDANYYQHKTFLASQEKAAGYDFEIVRPISNQPLGLYSEKFTSLDEVESGARVAIPNDPANGARGLWLLQDKGLITLAETGDTPPTPEDVTDNPKNLEFVPVEAAQTVRSVGDVEISAVPGNYAVQNGLEVSTALAAEDPRDERFVINLVTTTDKAQDERITKLSEVLGSEEVGSYIEETWKGTVVQLD